MINSLLIKYENTIMKHYRYAQEQNIYIKLLKILPTCSVLVVLILLKM